MAPSTMLRTGLTAAAIKNAKGREKPYKLTDSEACSSM